MVCLYIIPSTNIWVDMIYQIEGRKRRIYWLKENLALYPALFFLTNFLPEADTAAFTLRQLDAVCFCANSDRLCTRPIGHLQLNIYWI